MIDADLLASRSFVALDFETACNDRNSACAVCLVRVENDTITRTVTRLIRPPRSIFLYTYIHGITWGHVARENTFGDIWPELEPMLQGAGFIAAHNAPFDRGVLNACCQTYGIAPPSIPFLCTVQLARKTWRLRPARLPDVCRHLDIELNHHDAESDAQACAQIVLACRAGSIPARL